MSVFRKRRRTQVFTSHSVKPRLEYLEERATPASVLTFTDVDGDSVRIVSSRGDLTGKATFANVNAGQQLQMLDLTDVTFQGTSISTAVRRSETGDGLVNIGYIHATGRDLGTVSVRGDLGFIDAGSGVEAKFGIGTLSAWSLGRLGKATQGGTGFLGCSLDGYLGTLKVLGDVKDASVYTEGIGKVTVGGSILGGLIAGSKLGSVRIAGDVAGGVTSGSGCITSQGRIGAVVIGGSLIGGQGLDSGQILCSSDIGSVTIGRDLLGGASFRTGRILANNLGRLTIGGSMIGGRRTGSGVVSCSGNLGTVRINGDLKGASISGSEQGLGYSGVIQSSHRIKSIFIGGSVITGVDDSTGGDLSRNATIRAGDDIGLLVVKGGLIGHATANGNSPVVISARGQVTPTPSSDLAIGQIKIGGNVEDALILAGYLEEDSGQRLLRGINGNAQIGRVTVGGDWVASSLVAGVQDTSGNGFGNADDSVIGSGPSIAKIGSVTVRGSVSGTQDNSTDHFGFVSHHIGSFRLGSIAAPLTPGTDAIELSPISRDVAIREV